MRLSSTLEIVVGVASAAMFVGSILAIPWLVRRLPPDYFVRPPQRHSLAKRVLRNTAAVLLIALGLAMLVLPGQGIITVLFGLSLLDIKAKDRALCWLLQRKKIQEGVQRLRSKKGKPPLLIPAAA